MDGRGRAMRLFGKEVIQSQRFTRLCQELGPGTAEEILAVTATYYPLFTQLKHGLVLGQLSHDMPPGYEGPGLQFIYKVLSGKIFFADLKVGGFNQPEVAAIESVYDL
jgi:hypothetical protein